MARRRRGPRASQTAGWYRLRLRSDRARWRHLHYLRRCGWQRALARLERHTEALFERARQLGAAIVSKRSALRGQAKNWDKYLGHRLGPNVQIATLSGNIPLEGHFSAHGMPHRPCVIFAACGSTRQDIRPRPRSPSWCPLSGDGVFVAKVRSLPSARGPGTSVEVAAAPGAWRDVGKCAGGYAGAGSEDSAQLHASKATKPICCLSASRRF
jgi:hypothetical protein